MAGYVTSTGAYAEVGGVLHRLPVAAMTLHDWVAQAAASGELTPCPHCGEFFGCSCVDWVELMTAPPPCDPHDDLSVWKDEDIPL